MSRTFKDKKWTLRFPEDRPLFGTEKWEGTKTFTNPCTGNELLSYTIYRYLDIAGAKTRKKRNVNDHWNWVQSTPSWWTRSTMNRPQRRASRVWERTVLSSDIEEADCPDYGKKPHIYFW